MSSTHSYGQSCSIKFQLFSGTDSSATVAKYNLYRNFHLSDTIKYEKHNLWTQDYLTDSLSGLVKSSMTDNYGVSEIHNLIPGNFDLEFYNDKEYEIIKNIQIDSFEIKSFNIYLGIRKTNTNKK